MPRLYARNALVGSDPSLLLRNFFWILLLFANVDCAAAQSNVVVVRPKEIHDVLVNPGMGITTFQRFNGQATNPPLKWSEVGPVAKLPQAPTKPDFPDTSISYAVFCLKKKKY